MIGRFKIQIQTLRSDALKTEALEGFFEPMVAFNEMFLRAHPRTPDLYASGVVYRREAPEFWKDIPTAMADGWDDCEGLSCWLAAELRVRRGEPTARVKLIRQPTRRRALWHAVVVVTRTGQKFDPSKKLGMRGAA